MSLLLYLTYKKSNYLFLYTLYDCKLIIIKEIIIHPLNNK